MIYWHKGDQVEISYGGHVVHGEVLRVSRDSSSVFLGFDGCVGGHLGSMHVEKDAQRVYRSVVTGLTVVLRLPAWLA